jgi:1,2-diacylglycerol 3-beta-glucosyltransferase
LSYLAPAAVALAIILALPTLALLGRSVRRRTLPLDVRTTELPRFVVLIPAHDEEGLIAGCVSSLLGTDYPPALRRVIVIADNCSDRTAIIARDAGAEVLERSDPSRPGKPAALAWALEQLGTPDYSAVVIVDADTMVVRDFLRSFAGLSPLEGLAAQGYFGTSNEWDNWLTRLAGLLARARYEHVYPSRERAGLNVPLTGNGMCLGRDLLAARGWDAFSLSEDLELYARLTAAGVPVRYAQGAHVHSQEAHSLRAGKSQRERWARGRLHVLREWFSPLVASKRIGALQKLDAVLELALPSPVIRLAIAAAVAPVGMMGGNLPGALLVAGAIPDVVAISSALVRHPQPARTIGALLMLPAYAMWRVAVAVTSVLTPRDSTWRKTERNRVPEG